MLDAHRTGVSIAGATESASLDDAEELVDFSLRQMTFLGRCRNHQSTRQLDLIECLVVAEATVQGLWHSWSPSGDVLRHETAIVAARRFNSPCHGRGSSPEFEASPFHVPAQPFHNWT